MDRAAEMPDAVAVILHDVPAAALAADAQAGQQVLGRAPCVPRVSDTCRSARRDRACCLFPQLVGDDARLRLLDPWPFGFRPRPHQPLAGIGIPDFLRPIPDYAADVRRVVQNPEAPAPRIR